MCKVKFICYYGFINKKFFIYYSIAVIGMTRLSPLPPILLDPRNESDLVLGALARTAEASNGIITDLSPGSVPAALIEGCAFTAAQLLVYQNLSVEAWTLQFLSTVIGVGIVLDSKSIVPVQFTRDVAYSTQSFNVPKGTLISNSGRDKIYYTTDDAIFLTGELVTTVTALSQNSGSNYSVLSTEAAQLISPIAQINLVEFLTNSYAGEDAETYGEAKSRAFNLLHRKSPINIIDWVDFTQDFLGETTKVIVTKGTTPGARYYLNDLNITLNYDGSLTNLIALMGEVGYTMTQTDVEKFTTILQENINTNDSIYISVATSENGNFSTNILNSLTKACRLYAQVGQQVYCNNCITQYVFVNIIFGENQSFNETQVQATVTSVLQSYFNTLAPGSKLNYNEILSLLLPFLSLKTIVIGTKKISVTALNESFIEEESFRYFLEEDITSNGTITYYSEIGKTIYAFTPEEVIKSTYKGITFNAELELIPQTSNVIWKIDEVLTKNYIPNAPGTLLRCLSGGSSVRYDENSEQITIAKDYACLTYASD
jgi:hypothetical protein